MPGLLKDRRFMLIAALIALVCIAALLASPGNGSQATSREKRVAQVLGAIEGAGRVEVALYYRNGSSSVWSGEGDSLQGAVIVADGADDMLVRLSLIRAARTLLGLPESAVDVFLMEDER